MIFRLLFCAGVAPVFIAGCGARGPVAPAVELQSGKRISPADQAAEHGEILLWARNEKGDEKTFRLAGDAPLKVIGEEKGIIIATTKGEMKWQAVEKEIKLAGCSMGDGNEPEPSKGSITIASLVQVNGGERQSIIDPSNAEGSDVNDVQHSAGIVGSIGPYLFIAEYSYTFACGAHGGTTASAMVWDAEQGKAVSFLEDLVDKETLAKQAKKMLEENGDELGDDNPEPVMLVPAYGDRGALSVDVQFAGWACYACSDGQWSSYTRSATVPTQWMPERMRPWVMPPVPVKEFLEENPQWKIRGWSRHP